MTVYLCGYYAMNLLTLVTLATAICCISACKLTGDVNTTSHKLHLTCECSKTDDVTAFPIRRLQGLKINKEGDRLAWLNMDRNKTERYAQNFTVLRSEFSQDQDHVLFTLLLDVEGEQSAMTFQCVAMGFGYNDFPMDYTVNRTIELSDYGMASPAIYSSLSTSLSTIPVSGSPNMPEKSETSLQSLIVIIVAACSIIIIVTIIAIVIATCRRSPAPVPIDTVPLEVVKSLLTAVTSPEARTIRHVTPSPSRKEYFQDGSYVSGTYASRQSDASTLYDLIPPSLPGDDVKMRVWLNDVKNTQGQGKIEFFNEHSAWSDDYDDYENDVASDTTRWKSQREMLAQREITNVNRKLPPIPVEQRSPPGVREAPRLTSPVNPQSSQANADLDLHPFPSTPPSPELTSLPKAPQLPVGEHPLPEEDGYIDMASAPSLDDQCKQLSGSVLSQNEDGYMTPVHPSLTGSTIDMASAPSHNQCKHISGSGVSQCEDGYMTPVHPSLTGSAIDKKQNSRERGGAGGQHLYQATNTDYLTPVCQQKPTASGRFGKGGRPNSRPRDPTYLTPIESVCQ